VSEKRATLRELAAQCRALARGASMPEVAASLRDMAEAYDREADAAEAREAAPSPTPPNPAGEG
jgi:hypothetical protein